MNNKERFLRAHQITRNLKKEDSSLDYRSTLGLVLHALANGYTEKKAYSIIEKVSPVKINKNRTNGDLNDILDEISEQASDLIHTYEKLEKHHNTVKRMKEHPERIQDYNMFKSYKEDVEKEHIYYFLTETNHVVYTINNRFYKETYMNEELFLKVVKGLEWSKIEKAVKEINNL